MSSLLTWFKIISHYSVMIMSCIYLKKLNFHIIPPIFLWIVFSFCICMHIYNFSVMDFVMDLIFFFLWQSCTSQKCHLSRISISSVNRKLLNAFIWALNLALPHFHYVARCFRGRNAFLVFSLAGEKWFSCLWFIYFLLGTHLSYTSSVLKWR